MPSYANFVLTLMASAGVSSVLSLALVWLARAWIGERLRASIQHEYNQKLAESNAVLRAHGDAATANLRAQIDREADKLKVAAQSFGEVQKAAISKRLAALEEMWKFILELQDSVPPAVNFLDLLLVEEYRSAASNKAFGNAVKELDHVAVIKGVTTKSRQLAEKRPYVGEYLWALFFTHQAVVLRTVYLVDQSKTQPEKILWHEDDLVRRHIRTGLGDSALADFDSASIAKVSWIRERFTHAILQAMERIIEGKEFGEAALQQAKRMETALRISVQSDDGPMKLQGDPSG